jgi:rod shape-determining protein MreD
VKVLPSAVGVLVALVVASVLSLLAPAQARLIDPFLIVLVYFALSGGETHGMLLGVVAGWVQDVSFGGAVVGLSGLSKLLVGFGVGLSGTRFLLVGPGQRLFVLFGASLFDSLIQERLAGLFEIPVAELSFAGVVQRAFVNAVVGAGAFALLDRWRPRRGGA